MSVTIANQTLTQFGKDTTGKISYTFNQQGFRSDKDYNFVPTYAFFGCSLVFGIGVPIEKVFTNLFNNSQNYGLSGEYNNDSVFDVINSYLKSNIYSSSTKLAVVWTDRNEENLDSYYHSLNEYNIIHFFCGKKLPYNKCYPILANIDLDVSNTHMGVKSHYAFYKTLCSLFNQS